MAADHKKVLNDTGQTAWQLAAIQLSGWTSLPILATSLLVLRENSFYGAALTIVVGNGLLWFIRLIIVLMSHPGRQSTLDLSTGYLGKVGGYCVGVLAILSALVWFVAQTSAASKTLVGLIPVDESGVIDRVVQMSVLLGVVSTLFCMNGMVVLRRLSVVVLPLLIIALAVVFFSMPFEWPKGDGKMSLSGLAIVMGVNLGITADLPTFFRHSRSLATSVVALTWIQVVSLVLALAALFFGQLIGGDFVVNMEGILGPHVGLLKGALVGLVFLSVVSANVANVYSASVGWEILAPSRLVGRKEYLILGLCLTTIFILVENLFSIEWLLTFSDAALINLSIVFLVGYFVSRLQRRLPDRFEKRSYFLAWILSSFISGIWQGFSLVIGIAALLLVLFFFWGARLFLRKGTV